MVDFQQISMVTLAVILMMNIGLLSVDASNTMDRKIFGDDTNGFSSYLSYEDLNASLGSVKPIDPQISAPCEWWNFLCIAQALSSTVGQYGAWLGVATNIVLFFIKYIPVMILGYHFALMMIANLLESNALGPIHILFTGISTVIFVVIVYGLWGVLRSIASLVPGVGGS